MELRRAVDFEILKAVVHVLDKGADEPIINVKELELTGPVLEFLGGHIIRLAADDGAIKGKMFNDIGMVYNRSKNIIETDDYFMDSSADIAKYLFKVIKQYDVVPSCDVVVIKMRVNGMLAVAILKMDYQQSVEHEIDFIDDRLEVRLAFAERTLPMPKTKLSCGAIIKIPGDSDGYDLIAIERIVKGLDGEPVEFFVKEVLQANRVVDHVDKTKIFHKTMENWLRKNVRNEMDKAIGIREDLQDLYENRVDLKISDVAEELIDDQEKREKFIETLEVGGFDTEETFALDKTFLEKKLKTKAIKTDTGISIRGSSELFLDPSKFEIKYNGDGTVNYIVKNVRNISQ